MAGLKDFFTHKGVVGTLLLLAAATWWGITAISGLVNAIPYGATIASLLALGAGIYAFM